MYNAHPYFPSKIWAKKCTLYTAKYSNGPHRSITVYHVLFSFDNFQYKCFSWIYPKALKKPPISMNLSLYVWELKNTWYQKNAVFSTFNSEVATSSTKGVFDKQKLSARIITALFLNKLKTTHMYQQRNVLSYSTAILWNTKTLKRTKATLAGAVQWIDCWPANHRVAGSTPRQGTCLGCRPGPQ